MEIRLLNKCFPYDWCGNYDDVNEYEFRWCFHAHKQRLRVLWTCPMRSKWQQWHLHNHHPTLGENLFIWTTFWDLLLQRDMTFCSRCDEPWSLTHRNSLAGNHGSCHVRWSPSNKNQEVCWIIGFMQFCTLKSYSWYNTKTYTTSMWILGNWPKSSETCLMQLENLQI